MIGLNKKAFSLRMSRNIMSLLQKTKALQEANSDIIEITYPNDSGILLKDKEKSSPFHFNIAQPLEINGICIFQVKVYPENENSNKVWEGRKDIDTLFIKLEEWLSLIKIFNDISYTQQDSFQKIYEQEFIEIFEIIDDDADTVPYDLPRQLFLDHILADISNTLEKNSTISDVQEIIEETNQLRLELPISTKKVVARKLGKILSKIRMKAFPLLKEVLKDILKDQIKGFINERASDVITFFHNNIHLLQ